ncbi:MAG: SCO family protein, partial [Conexibacteraceae bacterium]|nr:SCO family protein [Conexibacteraceae bacterium]
MRRLVVLLVLLGGLLMLPAAALGDGDPGSDVLLDQNLFASWDANLSAPQQLQLGKLLDATTAAGAPVRVAIIAHQDDLGTVTSLWLQPQTYASYLGTELSLTYRGRLLIVMPNGYGVYWKANPSGAARLHAALAGQRPASDSAASLVAAVRTAVLKIEAAGGVGAGALSHGATPTPTPVKAPPSGPAPVTSHATHGGGSGSSGSLGLVLAIIVIVVIVGYLGVRFGRLSGARLRLRPMMLVPVGLLAVIAVALVVNQSQSGPASARGGTLGTNAELDPGTALPGAPAPGFTLVDESGHRVSLAQYRGKVVVLSFVDDECQTICPLTTQAMLDAKASLGKAGKDVQLLGVNANWKSTQVEDVLNYTEQHGLAGQWHFLTTSGPLPQLERVWTAYHVNEKALMQDGSNDIEHVAATYIIDSKGRLRDVFTTYPSYAAIAQAGQLIAHDVSALLPGRPHVATHYSYAQIRGISPSRPMSLPKLGGGGVRIGRGAARLYLFFATWDAQTTPIGSWLDSLNGYAAQAHRLKLPPLVAVDEGSVEPSSGALPAFIHGLSAPLSYPVGIDQTGRIADGYGVQGEPWFVLTNAAGEIVWYQEVYTAGWPTLAQLETQIRAALSHGQAGAETPAA